MRPPTEKQALQKVAERLAELMDFAASEAEIQRPRGHARPDAVLDVGGRTFVVQWKSTGAAAPVALAAEQVRMFAESLGRGVIPLVAIPFMGHVGRQECDKAGVGW